MEELELINKKTMPLLPLRGLSIFPHMVLHFDVGREKSILSLEQSMVNEQLIFLVSQKDAKIDNPIEEDIYHVGTVSKIKQILKLPGDTIRVLVEGISRAEIIEITQHEPYFQVDVLEREDTSIKDAESDALMRKLMESFEDYVKLSNQISPEVVVTVSDIEEPGMMADVISSYIFLKQAQKQELLEAFSPKDRLNKLYGMIQYELDVLRIERKIGVKVKKQIDRLQKEYYLREQMKAIQEELGDKDGQQAEIELYRKKIDKAKLPKEVKEKALSELGRLEKMGLMSAESGVIRTYLDWILDLPWSKETKDNLDIKNARDILESEHYGLKDVKERIIEYLAIRKLNEGMKGPILCLIGPPGVGKTSIVKSIATALNRSFVRMSLGGVRDEAEIRGHRKTYVGAIPGRIINGMKHAGSKNPVFLFDEIDKMSSDFRGDPADAMLEVLDPEQNNTFRDHYLELPFDLSKVMFITTANNADTIPRPLLDRMELIEVSGYTEEEKLNIAQKHLLPKQIKEHGMKEENLEISEAAMRDIINKYTRESGVRTLERRLATICRKAATMIVEENKNSIKVNPKNLVKFLGTPRYRYDVSEKKDKIGVVTGLAWTAYGGDTLPVEVSVAAGNGKLELTGQLGDVMKESARAGYSYIRAHTDILNIDKEFHKNYDLHIHVPEGAVPKDGPSAGVTMVTAMVSALSNNPVRGDVAMTGEITLTGRVLPIGGLKEKALAAKRAGINTIIIPVDNERDIQDIPDNVRKKLNFILADNIDTVLKNTILKG
ncbi:Lon protease 1 [Oxobacter pfennigii]|uniref:Lon protease n=2 Tax=Oxobacter pfennigii TaxID=36849 RepID=A0A0P8WTR3_9CLOT|nr:Lon protease 1 [Oxobacter pfennigii]